MVISFTIVNTSDKHADAKEHVYISLRRSVLCNFCATIFIARVVGNVSDLSLLLHFFSLIIKFKNAKLKNYNTYNYGRIFSGLDAMSKLY